MVEEYDAYGTCPRCGEFWVVKRGRMMEVERKDPRCTCGARILDFVEPMPEDDPRSPDWTDPADYEEADY